MLLLLYENPTSVFNLSNYVLLLLYIALCLHQQPARIGIIIFEVPLHNVHATYTERESLFTRRTIILVVHAFASTGGVGNAQQTVLIVTVTVVSLRTQHTVLSSTSGSQGQAPS